MKLAQGVPKEQITIRMEIRRKLGIKDSDKVLVMEDGTWIYMMNLSTNVLRETGEINEDYMDMNVQVSTVDSKRLDEF